MSLYFCFDPFGKVRKVIESWRPRGCITEKEFEASLLRKLKKELKGKKIQGQYGSGRQRVDIVVDDKVPIEVKKDIKNTSTLHRLIGQIDNYLNNWGGLIIVICGEITSDHQDYLEQYARNKSGLTLLEDGLIVIIK